MAMVQAVNEDITFIQSQDRGLQVQTQNQRALLSELQELLVRNFSWISESALTLLASKPFKLTVMHFSPSHKSPSRKASIASKQPLHNCTRLSRPAVTEVRNCERYGARLLTLRIDMAASMERLEEYRTYNAQFCKRLYDFLSIMCTAQVSTLLIRLEFSYPLFVYSPSYFLVIRMVSFDLRGEDPPSWIISLSKTTLGDMVV